MGTKLRPGRYDCHEKARPHEPLFTLLGRDRAAPILVRMWAHIAELTGTHPKDKIEEALALAEAMERYFITHDPLNKGEKK